MRAGVIGVGVHGLHHVRLLSAMDGVDLAGVYDLNKDIREKVASEFGTRSFDSIEDLLREVDCVSVIVPTSLHHEVVMTCLEHDKHVLVEKPITASLEEADAIIAVAEKRGLVLSVGQLERFNPAYRQVSDKELKPVFIESHRLSIYNPRGTDVAVVLDLMIHDIDIILDMVKKPVLSVNAVGVSVVSDEIDIANARIEFEGGCVANLTASRISQKKMRKLRIFQKNAYISMDLLVGETEAFELKQGLRPEAVTGAIPQMMDGINYKKYQNDGLNALGLEIADFIHAVGNKTQPRVTGRDGRKALEVAMMVMASMEESARRLK